MYFVFHWYLGVRFVRSAVLLVLPIKGAWYFYFWILTEPILWLLNVLVVRELFTLVLAPHPAIQRLGRWLVQAAFAVGLIAAALLLQLPAPGQPGFSYVFQYVLSGGRIVTVVLMIFLLFLVAFLNWYPISLSRNLVLHCFVFTLYFLSLNFGYLARPIIGPYPSVALNLALVGLSALFTALWLFMTPAGEKRRMKLRAVWSSGEEQALVSQLEAFNSQLSRLGRK
jgi:hypothetical protein